MGKKVIIAGKKNIGEMEKSKKNKKLTQLVLATQIALQLVAPIYSYLPGIAKAATASNDYTNDTRLRLDEVGDEARARSPFAFDRDVASRTTSGAEAAALMQSPFSVDRDAASNALPDLGSSPSAQAMDPRNQVDNKNNQLAQDFSTAARLASSEDVNSAASGYMINHATGYAGGHLQDWLHQFGTAKVDINVDDSMNFNDSSLDLLVPLYDSASRMIFSQVGARYSDDRWMANMGLGQRHFIGSWMVGYNLFFDQDLTESHSRAGAGLELWRDYLKLSGNGYYRLTDWKQSTLVDNYQSRPANGYDLKAEGYLPAYPQLGASLGYEKYYGNNVALFGHDDDRKSNPSAVSYGLSYTPIPLVELSATYKDGQSDQSETEFAMQFNYTLGVPMSQQVDPSAVALKRSLAGSRYDLVDRNNTIVLDYKNNAGIKLALPQSVSGQGNTAVALQATVESANGLDHIAWDDSSLRAAGGNITGSGTSYSVHLPSYVPGGVNTYMLAGIAYDTEGHKSSTASTAIGVLTSSIDPQHAQVSASPSTIKADGSATSTVSISLEDNNGEPITGQSSGFTFSLSGSAVDTVPASARSLRSNTANLKALVGESKKPIMGSVKEISAGKYQAVLTSGTTAGELNIMPSLNGSALPLASVMLTADSSDVVLKNASLIVNPDNSAADNQTLNQAQVTVVDGNGNPVPGISVDWSLPTNNTTASLTVGSSLTDNSGVASVGIKDSTAESILLTAKVNGSELSTSVNFTQYDNSAVIKANSLTVKEDNTIADGKATKTASVMVVDGTGQPLNNIQVGWVVSGSAVLAGSGSTGTSATSSSGVATITLTDVKAESVKVTATVNGQSQSVSSTFQPDNNNPVLQAGSLVIKQNASPADNKSVDIAQVTVVDGQGNTVQGASVTWSLPSGNNTAKLSATSTSTDDSGTTSVSITDTQAETISLTVSLSGSDPQSKDISFTQDNNSAVVKTGSYTLVDNSTPADGTTAKTATVVVVDGNGTPLNNVQVNWAVNGAALFSNGTPTASSASGSDGTSSVQLTDKKSETVTVSVSVNNQGQSLTSVFVPADGLVKRIIVSKDNSIADGSSQNSATALVLDANNNPVPSANVTWSSTSSTIIYDGGVNKIQTNQYGIATIKYADTTSGSQTLTATLDNAQAASAATQFAVDPGTISIESIELVSPVGSKVISDGLTTYTYKAKVVDNIGPTGGMGVTWSLSSGTAKFVGNVNETTSGSDGYAIISFTDTQAETITLTAKLDSGSSKTQSGIEFIGHYSITATMSGNAGWATDSTTFGDAQEYTTVNVTVKDNTTGNPVSTAVAVTATPDSGMIADSPTVNTSGGNATFKFASTVAKAHTITFAITGDSTGSKGTGSATIVASPRWPNISEWVSLNNQNVGRHETTCDVSTTDATQDKWSNNYTSSTPSFNVVYKYEGHSGRNDSEAGFQGLDKSDQTVGLTWNGSKMSVDQQVCAYVSRNVGDNNMDVTYSVNGVSPLTTVLQGSAHFTG